jgi:uncharacterized cupredoxin-like copper-binding protein
VSLRVLAIALVAVLAGCGADGDEAAAPGMPRQTVEISETEFALSPATVNVEEAGTYTFRAKNDGEITHALELEGNGVEEETGDIAPGASADVTVELEPGTYEVYCPIGSHRDQGMEASLLVAGGGAGGTGTTGEDEDDSKDGPYSY